MHDDSDFNSCCLVLVMVRMIRDSDENGGKAKKYDGG